MNILKVRTETGEVFVRQFSASDLMITGIKDAAVLLETHPNNIRKLVDEGTLDAIKLPTGVRRIKLDSLLRFYEEMHGLPAEIITGEENQRGV